MISKTIFRIPYQFASYTLQHRKLNNCSCLDRELKIRPKPRIDLSVHDFLSLLNEKIKSLFVYSKSE